MKFKGKPFATVTIYKSQSDKQTRKIKTEI